MTVDGTVSVDAADIIGGDGVPCVIRALNCDVPLAPPARVGLGNVTELVLGRGAPAIERDGERVTMRIADDRMSTTHARIVRRGTAWTLEDAASKNGTTVNGERCQRWDLVDGDVIETGHTYLVYRASVPRTQADAPPWTGGSPDDVALVTFSAALAQQYHALTRLAASSVPVIVLGETGTGKEVIARTLHRMSARTGPFVAINCGAIPVNLIESELFGVKRGAFSGATEDRIGLIRSADGGTLFLDEIGELPLPAQVALLRVLQEGEVMPIGGTRPVKIDVRVAAATHRPLERLVDSAEFRADLFARLSGLTLRLPALRDRREDLGLIIASLFRRLLAEPERAKIARPACRALFAYGFPRNIRELEKALELALAIATNPDGERTIELQHLPDQLQAPTPAQRVAPPPASLDDDARRHEQLVALLVEHHGRVADVARAMGKARMQIHRWIQRYGIDLESYRKA